MKDRYSPLFKQAEKATSQKERTNSMLSILEVLTSNHIPTIEAKVNKLLLLGGILLLAVLFSSKDSISWLWMIITKLF